MESSPEAGESEPQRAQAFISNEAPHGVVGAGSIQSARCDIESSHSRLQIVVNLAGRYSDKWVLELLCCIGHPLCPLLPDLMETLSADTACKVRMELINLRVTVSFVPSMIHSNQTVTRESRRTWEVQMKPTSILGSSWQNARLGVALDKDAEAIVDVVACKLGNTARQMRSNVSFFQNRWKQRLLASHRWMGAGWKQIGGQVVAGRWSSAAIF